VAREAFIAHVEPALAVPIPPVRVLGIDETRRGKPQWGQDPVTGRWTVVHDWWHTAVVDADGTAALLADIEGPTAAWVTDSLKVQPQWRRAGVTHVSIDLSASYLLAVTECLPHGSGRRVVAPGRARQHDAHPGPSERHPGTPWTSWPQAQPGVGRSALGNR